MSSKTKKIIWISAVVLAVGAVAYYGFFYEPAVPEPGLVASGPSSAADSANAIVGREMLLALRQLKSIKIDQEFLDSELFLTLEDFGKEIEDQPIQRRNPFAPIGGFEPSAESEDGGNEEGDLGQTE